MLQSQSSADDAKIDGIDQKNTVAGTTTSRMNQTKEDRLDKAVKRLSSLGTLFQCVSTIPPFVVEVRYGTIYMNQCPIQPLINIFLIVHGCASITSGLALLIGFIAANYIKRSASPSPCARRLLVASLIGQLILLVFSIAWLIAGQVWVFGAQTNGFQSDNPTQSTTYCQSTVFWTGFVIIIVTYAIWIILILVFTGRYIMNRHKNKERTAPITDEHI